MLAASAFLWSRPPTRPRTPLVVDVVDDVVVLDELVVVGDVVVVVGADVVVTGGRVVGGRVTAVVAGTEVVVVVGVEPLFPRKARAMPMAASATSTTASKATGRSRPAP